MSEGRYEPWGRRKGRRVEREGGKVNVLGRCAMVWINKVWLESQSQVRGVKKEFVWKFEILIFVQKLQIAKFIWIVFKFP